MRWIVYFAVVVAISLALWQGFWMFDYYADEEYSIFIEKSDFAFSTFIPLAFYYPYISESKNPSYFIGGLFIIAIALVVHGVTCVGIANDENNNKLITSGGKNVYHTLLKYDVDLGDKENTVNVVSTTGQGILLSGVKLSEIPGAIVDYAHGTKYLKVQIPQEYQDSLGDNPTLEVISGTKFENYFLDNVRFTLSNNKWQKINPVDFVSIKWNEIDYDFYGGKKGVLLEFSGNLSNKSTEYNGGIRSTNFASTVGKHIMLGEAKLSDLPGALVSYYQLNLMFIYAELCIPLTSCVNIFSQLLYIGSIYSLINDLIISP